MKQTPKTLMAIAALWLAAGAQAAEPGEDLAKKNGCAVCHSTEQKLVGPSFKEIAAKYKGQKGPTAMLSEKVKKGSSGTWGQVIMPPNGHVPDEDIKAIVDWILTI